MKTHRLHFSTVIKYLFLIVVCLFSVFPFYWMIASATNMSTDVISGRLVFGTYLIENIKGMLSTVHIGKAFWNSLRTSVLGTLGSMFICSLAGYGFQVFRDKNKDRLMNLLLLSMMIPFASIMVPMFRMFSHVHLLNTTIMFH